MKVIRSVVLACLGALLPMASLGQAIVWTDANGRRIQRKNVNGGEVQSIVQFEEPQGATVIHYDPVTAKLYYLFFDYLFSPVNPPSSFQRANLDGSEPENIPTPTRGNFTLNVESRKLYWIESTPNSHISKFLHRSELDGSGVESHAYPSGLLFTLEAIGDDLYFGANMAGKGIWRADPDGSNELFLHDSGQPLDLAHDPVENKLYWVAHDHGILRMNPDGTGFEQVVFLEEWSSFEQVAVDARARKLYWTYARVIRRSNLDGSNVEDFVTASDSGNPNFDIGGLTIVYTSDCDGGSNLKDFAALQICFTGEGGGPYGGGCEAFDYEADQDVDLSDYRVFFQLLTLSDSP